MKTDLSRILSVSGQPGLWEYVSQARNGIVAESLATKNRTAFGVNAKVTSLGDISVYTDEGECSLKDLFLKLRDVLGDKPACDPKADNKSIVALFEQALPDYDRDRFYVSHMKKVCLWYNIIREFASFDFEEEKEEKTEEE